MDKNQIHNLVLKLNQWDQYHKLHVEIKKHPLMKISHSKRQNVLLAKMFQLIHKPKLSERVLFCSNFIKFINTYDKKNLKMVGRIGCGNRWCPICQKAQAREDRFELMTELNYLNHQKTQAGNPRNRYIFVTPTIPNVEMTATAIKNGYYKLQHSVKKLLYHFQGWGVNRHNGKRFHGFIKGALVKHELTVNVKEWTVNIHAHIVLVVKPKYFHRDYLSHKQWRELWQKCLGTKSYRDIFVEVPYYKDKFGRKITLDKCSNQNQIKMAMKHMSSEMSKYETKSQDFITILKHNKNNHKLNKLVNCFSALYYGLKHTRKYYRYGLIYFLHAQFNKKNLEKYEPIKKDRNLYIYNANSQYDYSGKKYSNLKYSGMTSSQAKYYRTKFHIRAMSISEYKERYSNHIKSNSTKKNKNKLATKSSSPLICANKYSPFKFSVTRSYQKHGANSF